MAFKNGQIKAEDIISTAQIRETREQSPEVVRARNNQVLRLNGSKYFSMTNLKSLSHFLSYMPAQGGVI